MRRTNTTENDTTTVFTRIPVNSDPVASWNAIEKTIVDAERDTVVVKVSDLKVADNKLEANGKVLSLEGRGMNELLTFFNLQGAANAYSMLSTAEHKAEAKESMQKLLTMTLAERANAGIRLHTMNVRNEEQLVFCSSAKFDQPSILEQFETIKEASAGQNLRPIEFFSDLDRVRMKLIEVDSTWDLSVREDSLHGHQFFGDNAGKRDTFHGLIEVILSETKSANKLKTGTYASICENGAIMGEECAIQIMADRRAKANFALFLKTAFEAVAGQSVKFKDSIDKMSTQTFSGSDFFALEKTMQAENITRQWEKFLVNDVKAMVDKQTRRRVFDLITLRGHDERIPLLGRQRLEEIGGQLITAYGSN